MTGDRLMRAMTRHPSNSESLRAHLGATRTFTTLLNECREAGIKTHDIAAAAKWSLDNGGLSVAAMNHHIETLRGRLAN